MSDTPVWWSQATTKERSKFKTINRVPLRFRILKCTSCCGPFIPKHHLQHCCTDACSNDFSNENRRISNIINHDKVLKKKRAYNKKNKDKINKESKERYQKNKEEILNWHAQYRRDNRQKCNERSRNSQKLPGRMEARNQRLKQRRLEEPVFRLVENIRSRVCDGLRRQTATKNGRSFDLIGMTGKEFMEYLLSHNSCQPEFTADNYGAVWHVDHIRPLASFNLANESQQKEAFHYSNCQPLSVEDNLKKSSFYEGERHHHARYN